MVRLQSLKTFCLENRDNRLIRDVVLDESGWASLDKCVATLQPFKKYSLKLQNETCTLSDFFGFWTSLKINLLTKTDDFSRQLLKQMNERNDMLMNNPALIAAVYLDPRYQRALKEKKELAIEVLLNFHSRLKMLSRQTNVVEPGVDSNDMDAALQQYLDSCGGDAQSRQSCRDMKAIIRSFDNLVVVPVNTSVLEFWKEMKLQMPELYELAQVVMAIPPTQTTVERAFSALKLLLTALRTNLGDELLQDILLVRFNKHLLDKPSVN